MFCCIIIANMMKRLIKLFVLIALFIPTLTIYTEAEGSSLKILFTANLSDCIESVKYLDEEDNVKTYGGYSKIKNLFYQNSDENTIVVDVGNFSGSNIYSRNG